VKSATVQLAAASLAFLGCGPAIAADISAIKLDKQETALVVTGDIQPGDGAKFRAEASKYVGGYVLLESDGGSLADAIDIGETIRLKGYATAVINNSACNSACALIWLAGTPRALSRSGRIGFHAAYSDESGSAQESGVANAMVGRYLTLLNLPEKAVVFATKSPPSQLSWLTSSNYSSTGIDVTVIDDIDLNNESTSATAQDSPPPLIRTVTAPPSPSAKAETSIWRETEKWTVYVDHTLKNGCFLLGAFDNDTVFRIGVDRTSSSKYYVILGNAAWESLRAGQKYNVEFRFDENSPWDAPTIGVDMDGTTFLRVDFTDPQFWNEFTGSRVLSVTRNGEAVTKISLAGTSKAFDELASCQKFEDSHTRPRDPFAH
jgi:hypothetical protein